MKRQLTTLFNNISKESLKNLTIIVAETLAKDVFTEKKRTFTSAELWNIQRNKRAVTSRGRHI